MTTSARDAWDAKPAPVVPAGEILRPRDMLARYGYDRTKTCGACAHFFLTTRKSPRCLLSLNGNDPAHGWTWRGDWKACGKHKDPPGAPPPPDHSQPTLL